MITMRGGRYLILWPCKKGMFISIPQCIILEIPEPLSQWQLDFDRVFLEIPLDNCIVGMLLTCTIEVS